MYAMDATAVDGHTPVYAEPGCFGKDEAMQLQAASASATAKTIKGTLKGRVYVSRQREKSWLCQSPRAHLFLCNKNKTHTRTESTLRLRTFGNSSSTRDHVTVAVTAYSCGP
jgi:hypothetical protein